MAKSPLAFRTISEVAQRLDLANHVLRFWESKFPQIKPIKRAGGRRYYRPDDIALLGGIKYLLHDQGLTIKAAKDVLGKKGTKYVAGLQSIVHDKDILTQTPLETKAVESVKGAKLDITRADTSQERAAKQSPEQTSALDDPATGQETSQQRTVKQNTAGQDNLYAETIAPASQNMAPDRLTPKNMVDGPDDMLPLDTDRAENTPKEPPVSKPLSKADHGSGDKKLSLTAEKLAPAPAQPFHRAFAPHLHLRGKLTAAQRQGLKLLQRRLVSLRANM